MQERVRARVHQETCPVLRKRKPSRDWSGQRICPSTYIDDRTEQYILVLRDFWLLVYEKGLCLFSEIFQEVCWAAAYDFTTDDQQTRQSCGITD
jgi:hypothetical protein